MSRCRRLLLRRLLSATRRCALPSLLLGALLALWLVGPRVDLLLSLHRAECHTGSLEPVHTRGASSFGHAERRLEPNEARACAEAGERCGQDVERGIHSRDPSSPSFVCH
ncbi:hypothetical protein DMC30DRAFT_391075 [Rhodotorula diobovata]|uniref:Uncharacterized protein n=1 Tax=Rhodotorula diobovata TaxID=5288 RepID=A0A5C5G3F8_9BASI|nr:hypothetical protein DMC30DRAFT_391075 [Rhodotorula diobovata]